MKKILMMILLGCAMLMPTSVMAQNGGGGYGEGDGNHGGPHNSPGNNAGTFITYNESSNTAYVLFLSDADDVEITVCIDDVVVDSQTMDVESGTQIPLPLSAYGSREIMIYVRHGATLLAVFNTTL